MDLRRRRGRACAAPLGRAPRGRNLGPLDGPPCGHQGQCGRGRLACTAGLRFRASRCFSADAFAVTRLRAAGVVLLGSTNMDEGALGAEGMNPWYGVTQNPLRRGHSSGSSSSSSAAAVAARHCPLSLGSDTIGSLRIPAAFCGVASRSQPTSGLVSLGGVVPGVHPRFDHLGPIVRGARPRTGAAGTRRPRPGLRGVVPGDAGRATARGRGRAHARLRGGARAELRGRTRRWSPPTAAESRHCGRSARSWCAVDLRRWDLARVRRAILALCELEMWRVHRHRVLERPDDFRTACRPSSASAASSTDDVDGAERRIAAFTWSGGHRPVRSRPSGEPRPVACTAFPHGGRHPHNTADLTAIASASGAPARFGAAAGSTGVLPVGLQLVGHANGDLLESTQLAEAMQAELARNPR
ncbi:MAG: amidase family protein [Steroidobacteraceae bacterium]